MESRPFQIMGIFTSSKWLAAVRVHQGGQMASMAQPVAPAVAAKAMEVEAPHRTSISRAFRSTTSGSVAVVVQAHAASIMTIKGAMEDTAAAVAVVVSPSTESSAQCPISTTPAAVMGPVVAMAAAGKVHASVVEVVKVAKDLARVAAAVAAAANAREIRVVQAQAPAAPAGL